MTGRLVVLGESSFAEEAADVAQAAGFEVVAHVRDEEALAELTPDHPLVCIEQLTPVRRRLVRAAGALGFRFATVVHPAATVKAPLGEGTLILPRAFIGAAASIGAHAIVNRGVLVGGGTAVGDYVTIGPGANIGAEVNLGSGVLVGMGATVADGRAVGANSVVGSGALVEDDVPERVQVLGVPAVVAKRA